MITEIRLDQEQEFRDMAKSLRNRIKTIDCNLKAYAQRTDCSPVFVEEVRDCRKDLVEEKNMAAHIAQLLHTINNSPKTTK